jgi:hypothetical protein
VGSTPENRGSRPCSCNSRTGAGTLTSPAEQRARQVQVLAHTLDRGEGPRPGTELGQDVFHVGGHRPWRDVQGGGHRKQRRALVQQWVGAQPGQRQRPPGAGEDHPGGRAVGEVRGGRDGAQRVERVCQQRGAIAPIMSRVASVGCAAVSVSRPRCPG